MSSTRPNFLLILADDLGYSDIGCFGGEIRTPNLDKLAKTGIRFSDYHTAPACSPTRSMIMSGTDCHIAGLGVMYEHRAQAEEQPADPERWNVPGHEGYLNHDVAAMPELLEDAGYLNLMSGKWHLGFRAEHGPSERGFHKSYAFLPGCGNHFGWEPHWLNGDGGFPRLVGHMPSLYTENGHRTHPQANTTNSPDGWYSSSFFADNLVSQLEDRSVEEKAKPFFAYLPFTAPHWPLQCLPEDRDSYKGMYDDGPDALRLQRLQRLIDLGLVRSEVKPHDVVTKATEWDEMTSEERKMSARAMEVYAGMVSGMDRAIGMVVDYLEAEGLLDNTVVIFQSDNGAEGAALEAIPVMGDRLLQTIDKYYNNSYDNLGNHDSFIWYGPRWAQASTAPHRLVKGHVTEGGIRVPMILRYPSFTQDGRHHAGSICHAFTTVMDILPTFLELADGKHPNADPATAKERKPYRGHEVYGMRGKSWVPYLRGDISSEEDEAYAIHGERDRPVGWEFTGRASLRRGKWKIVFMTADQPTGTGTWQLYDLSADQGETHDLAAHHPDKLAELRCLWETHQEETGTVFGPPVRRGPPLPLLPNQIGGDPIEDQKAWMRVGMGSRLPTDLAAVAKT